MLQCEQVVCKRCGKITDAVTAWFVEAFCETQTCGPLDVLRQALCPACYKILSAWFGGTDEKLKRYDDTRDSLFSAMNKWFDSKQVVEWNIKTTSHADPWSKKGSYGITIDVLLNSDPDMKLKEPEKPKEDTKLRDSIVRTIDHWFSTGQHVNLRVQSTQPHDYMDFPTSQWIYKTTKHPSVTMTLDVNGGA